MQAISQRTDSERYARAIRASQRVRWDIDEDVIQGRRFDRSQKYLPDGLSLLPEFTTLVGDEKRCISRLQGRTYANMFSEDCSEASLHTRWGA